MKRKSKSVDRHYRDILHETDKPWCWACGCTPPLERAHLSAGSGRCLRVEDRRLINLICPRHHSLHTHHGGFKTLNCREVLCLSDAHMLWLKRERDPDWWDPEFIGACWIGIMPEPEEPMWLLATYDRRVRVYHRQGVVTR